MINIQKFRLYGKMHITISTPNGDTVTTQVPEEANYVAIDQDKRVWAFDEKPVFDTELMAWDIVQFDDSSWFLTDVEDEAVENYDHKNMVWLVDDIPVEWLGNELVCFLTRWYSWARGGENLADFTGRGGLCYNAYRYCEAFGLNGQQASDLRESLSDTLEKDFPLLEKEYPFNKGGAKEYARDANNLSQHLNQDRLRWVAGKIGVEL